MPFHVLIYCSSEFYFNKTKIESAPNKEEQNFYILVSFIYYKISLRNISIIHDLYHSIQKSTPCLIHTFGTNKLTKT